jgi:hypothetical protein
MIAIIALIASLIALAFAGAIWVRLNAIEARTPLPSASTALAFSEPPDKPLEGLSVALRIKQDHPHPVFLNLLKEALLLEDARLDADNPEIEIAGTIVCNGYSDVYFTSELICSTPAGPFCEIIEKPPHGDRPENLAIETVARLKAEWRKMHSRAERGQALKELKD